MANRQKVKCPKCGEVKTTRGTENFMHCGSQHKISDHKYVEDDAGVEEADPEDLLDTEQEEQVQEQQQQQESEGQDQEDYEYTCGQCGHGFDRQLLRCPDCGKRFNWGAVE